MSSEFAPSETTPLRTTGSTTRINLNNNNIRLEAGVNGHMQDKMDSRRILCKAALDFFILLCVGFPILFFYLWGEPYKRGFFCDDESLKHPFHESTVKNWMLYIIGLVLPISIILTTEVILANVKMSNTITEYKFGDWDVPLWVVNAYKQIGVFGFGAALSQLTTDIAKYSIGRLRPHFISVCQPIMPDGTTCDSTTNFGKYIEEFTCSSEDSSPRMLKEMRLSFPSGHSSFSAFTMVYCAIFLQSRMTWRGSKLVKHFLQFLLIMLAWYTALSRVSDYKHHWSDALAGSLLGSLCALVVANYISDLFEGKSDKYLPSTRHDLQQGVRSTNGRV